MIYLPRTASLRSHHLRRRADGTSLHHGLRVCINLDRSYRPLAVAIPAASRFDRRPVARHRARHDHVRWHREHRGLGCCATIDEYN